VERFGMLATTGKNAKTAKDFSLYPLLGEILPNHSHINH
jgi:hypothetical protein